MARPPQKLRTLPLAATLFFVVSGGPNGLEDLVRQSGPGVAILLILVVPVIWSLPLAAMTAELTSALPQEGGYFVWVERTLGPFWGLTCAWWSWMSNWFDVALYPVLVVGLLKEAHLIDFAAHWPQAEPLLRLAVILPFVALNLFGVRPVGEGSMVLGLVVLVPFLILAGLGLAKAPTLLHLPTYNHEQGLWGSVGLGLSVVLWNYLGWDNLSTIAGEVDAPQKTFPRAIGIALPAIVVVYLLVVAGSLAIFPDWRGYESGIWVEIARRAGGFPLFAAVFAAGIASSLGQFNGMLLGVSRVPFVLAESGYLPKAIAWQHPRWNTPVNAILLCTALEFGLAQTSLTELIELEVLLYGASILLELLALVVLRRREPELVRPFKNPRRLAGSCRPGSGAHCHRPRYLRPGRQNAGRP